ncbi:hypothetical protein [Streptococcus merionis]|uniref:hypothetical protein n=1 Tax=Streptococcus merionis TaxID=400065 RepID=UPI003511D614
MPKKSEIQYVKDKDGNLIPKHFKDFRQMVVNDNEQAEYLSMNFEDMDRETLGIQLEILSQAFDWIADLIDKKHLIYRPRAKK